MADTGTDNTIGTADDVLTPPVTAATGADGAWALTVTGSPCRVSADPASLSPGYTFGPHGTDSDTSVQFVAAGTTSVDIGVAHPSSYCQDNPQMAVSCFVFGDQVAGPNAAVSTLFSLPYTASGDTPPLTTLAAASQIGTTWAWATSGRAARCSPVPS